MPSLHDDGSEGLAPPQDVPPEIWEKPTVPIPGLSTIPESELKRSFGLIGMIGFSFSVVSSWSALSGVLTIALTAGGPPVIVWSWLGTVTCAFFVALSFAEMCSAYPTAGGQYSWVGILAPPVYARGAAYVTGWVMCFGTVAFGAVIILVTSRFLTAIVQLNHPDYVIERWHVVLVCYSLLILIFCVNTFMIRWLDRIGSVSMVINIISFCVVVITTLATNEHKQSSSFVFADFRNDTGFSASMAVMVGLIQNFSSMVCYDTPSHMTEEMENPSKQAPQAILASTVLGGITGTAFLLAAFFCIGDLESVVGTATGVPIVQIFYNSSGSVPVASFLTLLLFFNEGLASNGIMTAASRGIYAFARDGGLPCSTTFAKVRPNTGAPMNALLLCALIQMAIDSIYLVSPEGFNTVVALGAFGLYASYFAPLFARLWHHVTIGPINIPAPHFSLRSWGAIVNAFAAAFLLLGLIVYCLPPKNPVTTSNMNYCVVGVAIIGVISAATWFSSASKTYRKPV